MEQQIFVNDNGSEPASLGDQHLACVLLLDASSSMAGDAINSLNKAIIAFKDQCLKDDALLRSLDISVVSFASTVEVLQDFTPIGEMNVPTLVANGATSMGTGLRTAAELIETRKAKYKTLGVPYHRPWIFMISDGAPNDDYESAFAYINDMQKKSKMELWAVGVPGYDKEILTSLTKRVIELDTGLNFAGLFEFLSVSLSKKSVSKPGDAVEYGELPDGSKVVPSDWGK